MPESILPPLAAWESFYVIIGSSGAALTGLQFVVVALGAEGKSLRGPEVGAFATPTIVHFCVVLLLSALLSAPWNSIGPLAMVLGACGVAGLLYSMIVMARARKTGYRPVLEDRIWHNLLPFLANGALLIAAIRLADHAEQSMFVIGGVAMLLLLIGIHNAWDAVTYIAIQNSQKSEPGSGGKGKHATRGNTRLG